MSHNYKRKNKNDTIRLLAYITIVLFVFYLPSIIAFIVTVAIIYFFNIKSGKITIVSIIAMAVLLIISSQTLIYSFFGYCKNFLIDIFSYFINNNSLNIFTLYKCEIKVALLFYLLAVLIASLLTAKLQKNKKYQLAGVVPLNQEIEEIASKAMQKTELKETGVFIGKNKKQEIYVNYQHTLVSGTTGAGKSVLLSNYIKNACENNFPALLIDGKGDIGEGSLLEVTKNMCKKYNRKMYIINMSSNSDSDKYNPFFNVSATVAKDMLINLSEWTEEHYKLNVERYLQRLIKNLLLRKQELSLCEIVEMMTNNKFIELSNELLKLNKINKQEHLKNLEIEKLSAEIAKEASARFATLLESDINLFDNSKNDIYSMLKENAIVIFVLNPLLYSETSKALAKIAIIDCKKAISLFYTDKQKRLIFVFDEMNVYASKNFLDLINKSRSANVTCVCATQSLSDLDDVDMQFKNQMIENCNNYIVMRQNSAESAESWANVFGTRDKMTMTYQIITDEESTKGSARKTKEYIVHPDLIKRLGTGEAYYLNKKTNKAIKIIVDKPF